jgi:predicted ATPase
MIRLLQRPDMWLLMLTGPSDVGKTRLTLQIAAELLDGRSDGVWIVDLSVVRDPGLELAKPSP